MRVRRARRKLYPEERLDGANGRQRVPDSPAGDIGARSARHGGQTTGTFRAASTFQSGRGAWLYLEDPGDGDGNAAGCCTCHWQRRTPRTNRKEEWSHLRASTKTGYSCKTPPQGKLRARAGHPRQTPFALECLLPNL